MRFDTESTICAIATGAEGAFRGAIRVTGPDSIAIVSKVLGQSNNPCWQLDRATRLLSTIALPMLGVIDVAVFVWPDGRSYTGQPSVELHCLGNIQILQSIQARLIEGGAILAQPGEFTLRAFLAGRLDLTQCEAVLGVIHASSDRSLSVALSQLAGGLSEPLAQLRMTLVNLLADIEAGLDFVDEDIAFISPSQIVERLEQSLQVVREMLNQMESRAGQTVLLQVVIVGPPNAGKSSLINAIAKQPISIVSSEPGTTRDYVRLRLDLNGVSIDLLDTAGLESVEGTTPRALAQGFTQNQIQNADLILYCLPVDHSEAEEWSFEAKSAPVWLIRTKCDLRSVHRDASQSYEALYSISTVHRESIDRLLNGLSDWVASKLENFNQVVPITAARCQASLNNALQSLLNAKDAAELRLGDEVIASEIRLSLDEIGLVAGTVYTDDILDSLFSRFCIGK
jgi:tRNA modification GTPase